MGIQLTVADSQEHFLKIEVNYFTKGLSPPSSRAPFKALGAYAGSLGTPT